MVCYVEMLETMLMIYGPIFCRFMDRKYFLSTGVIQIMTRICNQNTDFFFHINDT